MIGLPIVSHFNDQQFEEVAKEYGLKRDSEEEKTNKFAGRFLTLLVGIMVILAVFICGFSSSHH